MSRPFRANREGEARDKPFDRFRKALQGAVWLLTGGTIVLRPLCYLRGVVGMAVWHGRSNENLLLDEVGR